MGKNCCVPKCNSGLSSQTPSATKSAFHVFPKENDLRQKWISKGDRKNNEKTNQPQEPTNNSFVCSKCCILLNSTHFHISSLIQPISDFEKGPLKRSANQRKVYFDSILAFNLKNMTEANRLGPSCGIKRLSKGLLEYSQKRPLQNLVNRVKMFLTAIQNCHSIMHLIIR